MQTIRLILSDIDSINDKTLGYIEDVEELIKKINAAFDDWRKFAEENGEKNRLVGELQELIDDIGNRYEELKKKHAAGTEKSGKLKEVYSSQKDNPDYLQKQKAIDKAIEEMAKGDSQLSQIGTEIVALAEPVDKLKKLNVKQLSIPQLKEQLEQARKVKKSIDGDIKKVDDVADQLSTKRTKIADAECPNNADLKGQALEKVEGKLQKIAEQLFDINIDPSSPSPKIAQEQ